MPAPWNLAWGGSTLTAVLWHCHPSILQAQCGQTSCQFFPHCLLSECSMVSVTAQVDVPAAEWMTVSSLTAGAEGTLPALTSCWRWSSLAHPTGTQNNTFQRSPGPDPQNLGTLWPGFQKGPEGKIKLRIVDGEISLSYYSGCKVATRVLGSEIERQVIRRC